MLTTMLFTDIEGSTRLARELGPVWRRVLAKHNRLVGDAIGAHCGVIERTGGDSVFALFDAPDQALLAATQAQRSLAQHEWPSPLKVRMGVHTGVIERGEHELVGLDVHLAARVQDAAHGGQVVITDATRAVVRGFELADLGEHRLKDFPAPEALWQLVFEGSRADDFPPLRTQPVRPTNLPADPRRLVGRQAELWQLRELLLGPARLVTIVGLGGAGKTRLAIAAAESLLGDFVGGVWLVPLAGIRDPDLLLTAVASAMGVEDREASVVLRRLAARPTLLVLDNFEHLVDGAHGVAALLDGVPGTRVLVTSQLPLRLAREQLLRLDALPAGDAVALFVERAAQIAPDIDLEPHGAAVEAICARVEGLPLAVELAAARVATLAPDELLKRVDRSLGVLVRGPRDLPERQRTLRDALEWTYALLTGAEQALLARLAAFSGPAPLAAIEAVAGEDALDALDGLMDASLARRVDHREHGVRYTTPQAVREFGAERLAAAGDEHAVRSAHARHLTELAEAAGFFLPGWPDSARAPALALQSEQHPALEWTRTHAPDAHARLASALGIIFSRTGRTRLAYAELAVALAHTGVEGVIGGWAAVGHAFAALTLELPDDERLMDRGIAALRAAGDPLRLQLGLQGGGIYWGYAGDPEQAVRCAAEALELARRDGHVGRLANELCLMSQALVQAGRIDEAQRHLDEAEPLIQRLSDSTFSFGMFRGDIALERGDWTLAARSYADSAAVAARHSTSQLILDLRLTALALGRLGEHEAALELDAAAAGIGGLTGETGGNPWAAELAATLRSARAGVGPERAAAAAERGRVLQPRAAAARADEFVRRRR